MTNEMIDRADRRIGDIGQRAAAIEADLWISSAPPPGVPDASKIMGPRAGSSEDGAVRTTLPMPFLQETPQKNTREGGE